jgi:hypothetical protein
VPEVDLHIVCYALDLYAHAVSWDTKFIFIVRHFCPQILLTGCVRMEWSDFTYLYVSLILSLDTYTCLIQPHLTGSCLGKPVLSVASVALFGFPIIPNRPL